MAKCLVLGANGFIGSHLVDSLCSNGHDVRVFGRFKDNAVRFQQNNKIEAFSGDFLNRNDLKDALQGTEYVFHFISTTTPASSDADPLIDVETNVRMSIELLQECVDNGNIKKVIFASTGGAIYGLNSGESIDEGVTPLPISPYAIGKLTVEHYLRYFETKYGLPSVVFRISNPYGERQPLHSKQGVIPIFLRHIQNHEPITILGDGTMVRDYIYVKDVADIIADVFEQTSSNLYNLGGGKGTSVNDLVSIIKAVTKEEIKINYMEKPSTFVQDIVLNTDKLRQEFSPKPFVDLEEGISKTWQALKKNIN